MSSVFFIAYRYLFSKKYKYLPSFSVFLTFFGIFLSVFTLVLVTSVMNGFKHDFENLIIGSRPHITIYPKSQSFEDASLVIKQIPTNNVLQIDAVTSGEGVVSFNNKTTGVLIKGIDSSKYFSSRKLLQNSIVEGNFDNEKVVIGIEIAKKMNIHIGDKITIISSKMRNTIFGSFPIHKTFVVSGFFSINMYIYDSSSIYIPQKDATSLFLDSGNSNAIEITLLDAKNTENFYKNLQKTQIDGYITNWKNDNKSFIDAIAMQSAVMTLILSAFLLIAGFIVFATISNIVNEKRRTIAILQSFGTSNWHILEIFTIFGFIITIPAILLGAGFGATISINLDSIKNWLENQTGSTIFDSAHYFLSYIPSVVEWSSIVKICFFALLLCFVCIVVPAYRATKVLPNEALRFE